MGGHCWRPPCSWVWPRPVRGPRRPGRRGSVNYVIPFNPGGESDVAARFQQPLFEQLTGQQLIIQYQTGAGGAQAWSQLNGMAGDGSTIMGTNLPHLILQPMTASVGYQTDDITNVYWFHYTPDAILGAEIQPVQDAQGPHRLRQGQPRLLSPSRDRAPTPPTIWPISASISWPG